MRPDPPIGAQLLSQFYEVLLRLAFALPLSYESYCQIEAGSGLTDGQSLHAPLLRAMQQVGLRGPVRLLVPMAIGKKELQRTLGSDPIGPADLVSIAANSDPIPRVSR